jgi:hypothetical protein
MKQHLTRILTAMLMAFLPLAAAQAQAATNNEAIEQGPSLPQTTTYLCTNGMQLKSRLLSHQGKLRVELEYPADYFDAATTQQILPLTGSLERPVFENDIADFGINGATAFFKSEETADAEAIPGTECRQIMPPEAGPLMQATDKGLYWVLAQQEQETSPYFKRYIDLESICFAYDDEGFIGWRMGSSADELILYNTDLDLDLGRVLSRETSDGEVAFVSRQLGRKDADDDIILHFRAPDTRASDLPSAGSGITRISGFSKPDAQRPCLDSDAHIYAAYAENRTLAISILDGELVLESFGEPLFQGKKRWGNGYVGQKAGANIFTFFDGNNRIRIAGDPQGRFDHGAVFIDSAASDAFAIAPKAYFVAKGIAERDDVQVIGTDLADLIDELSFCASLKTSRDEGHWQADLIEKLWEKTRCDEVPSRYRAVLAGKSLSADIRTYLRGNPPRWN